MTTPEPQNQPSHPPQKPGQAHHQARWLFGYGTLLHATGRKDVDDALRRFVRDCGPATLRGALYLLGGYPGAIPDSFFSTTASEANPERNHVHGRLLEILSPESFWPVIDGYEDYRPLQPETSEFIPIEATVQWNGQDTQAVVYAYQRPVTGHHRIASGHWLAWREESGGDLSRPQKGVTPEVADGIIARFRRPFGTVTLPLAKAAGYALAEDIRTDRDLPPFDRVAMDGIAVSGEAWESGVREFIVEDSQRAGEPRKTLRAPSGCLMAMTGAILPQGCDRVIRVEDLEWSEESMQAVAARFGSAKARIATSVETKTYPAFKNVHRMGVDKRNGQTVLVEGQVLRSPEIAIAASVGQSQVQVFRKPRVTIVTTGDELVSVDSVPLAHQVRHSNGPALLAGLQPLAQSLEWLHARDEEGHLRDTLTQALEQCDMLLLTGGVSMGEKDLVPGVLGSLGVQEKFHKVKQKPGKPLWFGVTGDSSPGGPGKLVFGLPGNPMSVMLCFHRFVVPTLQWCTKTGMSGPSQPKKVFLDQSVSKVPTAMTLMVPCRLRRDDQGRDWALPLSHQGSGDFASLQGSDGFVCLSPKEAAPPPDGPEGFAKGEWGWFHSWV